MQIHTHRPFEEIADMDLLSFYSMLESIVRVRARDKAQDVWSGAVAANGTSDQIKDYVRKSWGEALGGAEEAAESDIFQFMAAIGQGGGTGS